MASDPNIRVRVELSNITIQVLGGVVVAVLLSQSLDEAGGVAGIRGSLAIANLFPEVLPTLATAATEEKIVINLIIGCGICTVKDGGRGSFQ